jgi:hypothetical protein
VAVCKDRRGGNVPAALFFGPVAVCKDFFVTGGFYLWAVMRPKIFSIPPQARRMRGQLAGAGAGNHARIAPGKKIFPPSLFW